MRESLILLVGAGGHARACIDVIEQAGIFQVGGLVGLPDEVGNSVLGYPIVGSDADLPAVIGDYAAAIVSVGQIKSPNLRMRLFGILEMGNCSTPTVVSPRACVSRHATIGPGSIVLHGAVVNAGALVGSNCIINSQSLVEHDAVIADHCHIATAAVVNSAVQVGPGTFIGSGSIVRQGITIGERCLVGMGQRVLADCEAGTHIPTPKTRS